MRDFQNYATGKKQRTCIPINVRDMALYLGKSLPDQRICLQSLILGKFFFPFFFFPPGGVVFGGGGKNFCPFYDNLPFPLEFSSSGNMGKIALNERNLDL